MEDKEVLMKLGLTEKESRAYLLALYMGEINSGDLIKKMNIYSKTSYEILNKLVEKGFLSTFVKEKVKFYLPINPERLQEIIKHKQLEIDKLKDEIDLITPKLKKINTESKKKQNATVFEGKKGVKFLFEEVLKQKENIYVFGGGGKFKEFFPEYFELWNKQRTKHKIRLKLIYDEKLRNKKTRYSLCEIRFLPKEFDNPAPTMIFGNKVIITIWQETPLAFAIESKEVANSYKSYFDVLWKNAKK
ncbi:hypothetical protein J4477_00955 [Candidatus Pacearchaeota archaeon]|nr:hypothetical protein [Candidatus Pacearchaeota archaeon]